MLELLQARRDAAQSEAELASSTKTVNGVLADFLAFVRECYRKNGRLTDEHRTFQDAARVVAEMFGTLAATDFGPLKLEKVRDRMIENGWTRKHINKQVIRSTLRTSDLAISW